MNLDDKNELKLRLGFGVNHNSDSNRRRLMEVINAKLWFRGQPTGGDEDEFEDAAGRSALLFDASTRCWRTLPARLEQMFNAHGAAVAPEPHFRYF